MDVNDIREQKNEESRAVHFLKNTGISTLPLTPGGRSLVMCSSHLRYDQHLTCRTYTSDVGPQCTLLV